MRITVALFALVLASCSRATPTPHGPHLRYVGTRTDQTQCPMSFALTLANDGDDSSVFENLQFQVTYKTFLYDDKGPKPPDAVQCEVVVVSDDPSHKLFPGDWISVIAGETADVTGFVRWVVPPEAPPMLAIVRAEFLPMRRGDELLRTEPLVMYLQSGPGALEAVRNSTTRTAKQATELADALRAIEGKRTPDFEDLISRVEDAAHKGQ